MTDAITNRMLEFVGNCTDPAKLRQIALNAGKARNIELQNAAKLRLFAVLPSEEPGTLAYDVWQSIHALEDALSDERGKTIRLSRTRQKIARDGEQKTVADLVVGPASEGYRLLIERSMVDLTFEAVALRHPDEFTPMQLDSAKRRLADTAAAV